MEASQLKIFPANTTLPLLFKTLAEEKPDKEAFVFIDTAWNRIALTRKQVWDSSRKFAAVLKHLGLKKGDVVCNCLVNSPERLLTDYGTAVAGGVPLHGQVLLADGEDFFQNLNTSQCTTIIVDPGEEKGAYKFLKSIMYTNEDTGKEHFKGIPNLVNVIRINVRDSSDSSNEQYKIWLESLQRENFYECEEINAEDTAWMFVTSGTTGFSKIVPHTHTSLLEFGRRFSIACGVIDENRIYFCNRSLGWMAGQPILYPSSGCTRVLSNYRYGHPSDIGDFMCKMISQEKCDSGLIVPFYIQVLMNTIEAQGGQSPFRLRQIGSGGGPLSDEMIKSIGLFTDAIAIIYGSTECGLMCSRLLKTTNDFIPLCVGKPCPGVEVRIVNDDLEDVHQGKSGQIIFRSAQNTKGYLNAPEKNKSAVLPDGWFLLGDMAYSDEEGRSYIFSRKSDAIMRGTYIHYPGWMEARINACPGVQATILVGVPDKVNYEEICAFVIPTSTNSITEEYLRRFCDDIFVSTENSEMVAVPKYVLFVDTFPANSNGKIDRQALREKAKCLLQL